MGLLSEYRVLVLPGLHNSGPGHWQSRWQRLYPGFERVEQDDWDHPQLPAWSARLDQARARDTRPTLIVAHSFGCLTAVASVAREPRGVAGLLLVAAADPDKFGVAAALPLGPLPCPSIMISSSDDPWMALPCAAAWAARWGSHFIDVGPLGHINAESGLGDWLFGQSQLQVLLELAQSGRKQPAPA
ncbi:MAG TPA: alpha/beta hydrolase [Janthinobacterium sp.]|nr:alpha/beta hydrolase [Janthinobacterium sp.]